MSKQRTINIDSRQRTSGTVEDFTYQITPIQAKKIVVVDCILPNSWNNIDDGKTFSIDLQVDPGNLIDITIPSGIKLTTDQIKASLEAQFLAETGNPIAVEFSEQTGKFTFRYFAGAFNFVFATDNGAAEILGFPKLHNATGNLPYVNTIFAPNVTHIDGENYVLVSSNLAVNFTNGNSHHGVLRKIPINENAGNVVFYHNDDDILDLDQQISNINLKLIWWDNKPVNLQGREWSLSLKIFYD